MKPTHLIFTFEKRVAKQPTTQSVMAALRRSYVFKNRIGTTSNVSDIQRIYPDISRPSDSLIRGKYYIYIYNDKLRLIAAPIRAQAQQLNRTLASIWLSTRSFQDGKSNSLAQKRISQPPHPLQGMLQLRYPVDIYR